MGESVLYREHVSEYQKESSYEVLKQIKDKITFYGMAVLCLIPLTLMANGIGMSLKPTDKMPLIVQHGCNIGLNHWYIFLTVLTCMKLLIEIWRYMYVKVNF